MKLTNYKRGYIPQFDCSIHGTITLTREEYGQAITYLYGEKEKLQRDYPYLSYKLLYEDVARRIYEKDKKGNVKAFYINIRVSATEALVNYFGFPHYKRGNYQIKVIENL